MGSFFRQNVAFAHSPHLAQEAPAGLEAGPKSLAELGLNMPVAVSPSAPEPSPDRAVRSTAVMAHLDTGASITSIDISLAEYLDLKPTGFSRYLTAGGIQKMPTYVIDLYFPQCSLKPIINLPIGSCYLKFDVNGDQKDPEKFALLIGRDILSRWNIVWNGPTSIVIIND